MFEKPILFGHGMTEAILAGRKTQTRRVIKFPKHTYQPDAAWVASVNPDGQDGWIAWGPKPVTDDFSRWEQLEECEAQKPRQYTIDLGNLSEKAKNALIESLKKGR